MMYLLLFILSISNLAHSQQCSANITICQDTYQKKIINPLGINYISLTRLQNIIKYYNYNYHMQRNPGRNKRERRKYRKLIFRNRKLYSHSKELDYLHNICDIEYSKIDLKQIKLKYIYAHNYFELQRHSLIAFNYILLFGIIILFTFTFCIILS